MNNLQHLSLLEFRGNRRNNIRMYPMPLKGKNKDCSGSISCCLRKASGSWKGPVRNPTNVMGLALNYFSMIGSNPKFFW